MTLFNKEPGEMKPHIREKVKHNHTLNSVRKPHNSAINLHISICLSRWIVVLGIKRSNLENLRHNKQRDRQSFGSHYQAVSQQGANPSNLRCNLGQGHKHLQGGKCWAEGLQDISPFSLLISLWEWTTYTITHCQLLFWGFPSVNFSRNPFRAIGWSGKIEF